MKDSVLEFYDDLAEDYHLIFASWNDAISRQGNILNKFIRSKLINSTIIGISLLDCSCGIGTQAIGLAKHGFIVTATDLSPVSIERAKRESASFGVDINFGVADLRSLETDVSGEFNVVLSADNAIPHLQSDDDLYLAGRNMYSKVRKDGLLVVTMRDYDVLLQSNPTAMQPNVFDKGKRIVFQVWDWADDFKTYTVNHFVIQDFNGKWETKHRATKYRALKREEISSILSAAGFTDIRWHMPEESGYYQQIVTAHKK